MLAEQGRASLRRFLSVVTGASTEWLYLFCVMFHCRKLERCRAEVSIHGFVLSHVPTCAHIDPTDNTSVGWLALNGDPGFPFAKSY
jgi:hypothetical protein